MNVTVKPETSTVVLSGSYYGVDSNGNSLSLAPIPNPLTTQYGSYFFLDVQVYGSSSSASSPDGAPTGKITLTDNGKKLAAINLNSDAIAEIAIATLEPGTHELVVPHAGDSSFDAAKSLALTITITKGVPQVEISFAAENLLQFDPPYVFMPESSKYEVPVFVSSAAGRLPLGGTITVTYGSQSQTVKLLSNGLDEAPEIGAGTAIFTNETAGTFTLNASYSGDANLEPVSSAMNPLQVTVYKNTLPATTTTLTATTTTLSGANLMTITVKVTGGTQTPTGYVGIYRTGGRLPRKPLLIIPGRPALPSNRCSSTKAYWPGAPTP